MITKTKSLLLFFILLLTITAQGQQQVEMADAMRANGKIYVVVGIILIILIGLIAYLFLLDKKVKRLENILSDKRGQTK